MLLETGIGQPDPVRLQAQLAAVTGLLETQRRAAEQLQVERDSLRAERDAVRAECDTANAEVDKLRLMIRQLLRAQYGPRSEKLDPDQLQLGLEEVEQSLAATPAASRVNTGATQPAAASGPALRRRGVLPPHLPRYEIVVDVEDKSCPCCGGALHVIGEDVSEMLDVVPAQYRVRVIRRPRYGCRGCAGAVVQAPAPERPLTGGVATEAVLAQVLVAKYSDHLPLYRQAQIFARHGINLDRSTLAGWVGRACWWLRPLSELLLGTILSSSKIFADDTPVPVLDPGRGRTKTGRLWAYARDDRSWAGPAPPAVAYVYSENRKGAHPRNHLAEFAGVLQVDGYSGFDRLAGERPQGTVKLAFCWAHARRKFYDFHAATGSPIATEALRRIADIYAIEARIRGRPAELRRRIRQRRSKPLVDALKTWLETELTRISAKSALAGAIRYALRHWPGLTLFLDDGRVEPDTNTVERSIRPIKLGCKNHLFAGSDGGAESWATIASLIQTAKLNDVEPFAYLRDVLERIVSGRTKANDLASLLPWAWKASQAAAAVNP
jgi:transposase